MNNDKKRLIYNDRKGIFTHFEAMILVESRVKRLHRKNHLKKREEKPNFCK